MHHHLFCESRAWCIYNLVYALFYVIFLLAKTEMWAPPHVASLYFSWFTVYYGISSVSYMHLWAFIDTHELFYCQDYTEYKNKILYTEQKNKPFKSNKLNVTAQVLNDY